MPVQQNARYTHALPAELLMPLERFPTPQQVNEAEQFLLEHYYKSPDPNWRNHSASDVARAVLLGFLNSDEYRDLLYRLNAKDELIDALRTALNRREDQLSRLLLLDVERRTMAGRFDNLRREWYGFCADIRSVFSKRW